MIQIAIRDTPGLLQRSAYIKCTQNVLDMHMYTCRQTVILNTRSCTVNSSVNSFSSVTFVPPRASSSRATFVGDQVVSEYAGSTVDHFQDHP